MRGVCVRCVYALRVCVQGHQTAPAPRDVGEDESGSWAASRE